jgi:hypothetical protein
VSEAKALAVAWLARQRVEDGREPMLDEGDCRLCGRPDGEGHEPTDPCGIVFHLLSALQAQELPRAAIEAVVGRMIELRGLTNQYLRCSFCNSLGTDLHLPGCAIYELQSWLEKEAQ